MQQKKLRLILYSLFLIIALLIPAKCFAYQTILVDFPEDEIWEMVYNKKRGNETIVQFVPKGQSYKNWNKTFIFHSYQYGLNVNSNAAQLLNNLAARLQEKNNTQPYKLLKSTQNDSIAGRCITSNENIKAQCDIFRVTKSQEGLISIQYINKNMSDFKNSYQTYLNTVRDANPYYSAFRYDRVMSKGTSFEL